MVEWTAEFIANAVGGELHGPVGRSVTGLHFDSRKLTSGQAFVAITTETNDGHKYVNSATQNGMALAIVSKTVFSKGIESWENLPLLLVDDPLTALHSWALAHRRRFSIPVVAITGSNGKTTVKEMIAAALSAKGPVLKSDGNFNNHLGVPMTLLKLDRNCWAAVVEMGMSSAGEIRRLSALTEPTVGVITNTGGAHMGFFDSQEALIEAKWELTENFSGDTMLVLNLDDPGLASRINRLTTPFVTYSEKNTSADWKAENPTSDSYDRWSFEVKGHRVKMAIPGRHMIGNALAALAVADHLGVALPRAIESLSNTVGESMRMSLREIAGMTVIDDAYNANPSSMVAALDTLAAVSGGTESRRFAVLGGMRELGDASFKEHKEVGRRVASLGAKLLAVGELARDIAAGAEDAGIAEQDVLWLDDTGQAALWMADNCRAGDIILVKGSRGEKMEDALSGFEELASRQTSAQGFSG